MDFFLKILDSVISWPTVVLVVIIIFFRQIRELLIAIIRKRASLKLPGNIEFSLGELHEHTGSLIMASEEDKVSKALSSVIEKLPDKSPEAIKKTLEDLLQEYKIADLKLFLKTISYQLVAWLHSNRSGEIFSPNSLLNLEHIPVTIEGRKVGAYCIHSMYEKNAVVTEFLRNFWNLRRLGVIEIVDENQVRISQNSKILDALDESMQEVARVECERAQIDRFVDNLSSSSKFIKRESVKEDNDNKLKDDD